MDKRQSKGVGGNKIVRTEYWSLTKLLYHSQRFLISCKRGREEIIKKIFNSLIFLSLFLFLLNRRLLFKN